MVFSGNHYLVNCNGKGIDMELIKILFQLAISSGVLLNVALVAPITLALLLTGNVFGAIIYILVSATISRLAMELI